MKESYITVSNEFYQFLREKIFLFKNVKKMNHLDTEWLNYKVMNCYKINKKDLTNRNYSWIDIIGDIINDVKEYALKNNGAKVEMLLFVKKQIMIKIFMW